MRELVAFVREAEKLGVLQVWGLLVEWACYFQNQGEGSCRIRDYARRTVHQSWVLERKPVEVGEERWVWEVVVAEGEVASGVDWVEQGMDPRLMLSGSQS